MSTSVYAPGADRVPTDGQITYTPSRGAGGQFAEYIQGSTPKWAKNNGLREVLCKNTLARMYVRISPAEYRIFKTSLTDPHTRNNLIDRLIGDPANPRRDGEGIIDTGYMDFFLEGVSESFQEKVQVCENLADNYVAFFFGQNPPTWTFSGKLLNTVQDDQATNLLRLYLHVLRGTQLARRQKIVSIRYDSYIVSGALLSLQTNLQAGMEIFKPFTFQLLVKRIAIVNYTQNWIPTRPDGVFAADPNAVPFDGRPREETWIRDIQSSIPSDIMPAPGPPNTDTRAANASYAADATNGATGPVATPPATFTPGRPPTAPVPPSNTTQNPSQTVNRANPPAQDLNTNLATNNTPTTSAAWLSRVSQSGQLTNAASNSNLVRPENANNRERLISNSPTQPRTPGASTSDAIRNAFADIR